MLILPTVRPSASHLYSLLFLVLRSLADPFVRFFLFPFLFTLLAVDSNLIFSLFPIDSFISYFFGFNFPYCYFSCALFGTLLYSVIFSIISNTWVALAQWGAIPSPMPAGL
jgi:hypothetical protein